MDWFIVLVLPVVLSLSSIEQVFANSEGLKSRLRNNPDDLGRIKDYLTATGQASQSSRCNLPPKNNRFDCFPNVKTQVTKEACEQRNCCYFQQPTNGATTSVPFCYYPTPYDGYYFDSSQSRANGGSAKISRTTDSFYPRDVKNLQVNFECIINPNQHILHVKIFDPNNKRYETPFPKINLRQKQFGGFDRKILEQLLPHHEDLSHVDYIQSNCLSNGLFNLVLPSMERNNSRNRVPFSIQIKRAKNNETLFDTNVGGFIFSDQFIQLSSLLPSSYIYGLGEHQDSLVLDTDWHTYTLFNRDHAVMDNTNLYGSHPFFLSILKDGSAFGVYLHNSNAMDILLQPAPAITYRTTGGVLDFYFIVGDSPFSVISQYSMLIGPPAMPPYWGLGYHQCRYNYGSVNKTRLVWQRTRDAHIPYDVQWNDIDYMDGWRDFTYDPVNFKGLPQFVDEVHKVGMKYIQIIDPALSSDSGANYTPYTEGVRMNIFIKNATGFDFIGKVWPEGGAVFPDFTNPRTTDFWSNQFIRWYKTVQYDGIWLDMNDPSNFMDGQAFGCPDNSVYDNPPYLPNVSGGKLRSSTLCMTAKQNASLHYNVHNLFGFTEARSTYLSLKNVYKNTRRPFIISRSTFAGQGRYSGHWLGDTHSTWYDMTRSISGILSFSLFGMPLVGADICGFMGNTTVDLCTRWMQLGAFYPFSRNHNGDIERDQDPVALGPQVVESARNALLKRYQLMPYLYTQFAFANLFGGTVMTPMFIPFSKDERTYTLDSQFMYGYSIMVLPVLQENSTEVWAYFPAGKWFLEEAGLILDLQVGSYHLIPAPMTVINLAFYHGTVIPTKGVATNNQDSRVLPFGLIVTIHKDDYALGTLYWDDGETSDMQKSTLIVCEKFKSENRFSCFCQPHFCNYHPPGDEMTLKNITFYGFSQQPQQMLLDGRPLNFTYVPRMEKIVLDNLGASIIGFNITWNA